MTGLFYWLHSLNEQSPLKRAFRFVGGVVVLGVRFASAGAVDMPLLRGLRRLIDSR